MGGASKAGGLLCYAGRVIPADVAMACRAVPARLQGDYKGTNGSTSALTVFARGDHNRCLRNWRNERPCQVKGGRSMRTKLLALFAAALLALSVLMPTLTAFADPSPPPCAPGQQGNAAPGFKPGACDNK